MLAYVQHEQTHRWMEWICEYLSSMRMRNIIQFKRRYIVVARPYRTLNVRMLPSLMLRECHEIYLPFFSPIFCFYSFSFSFIFFFLSLLFADALHLIIYLFTWFLCPSAKEIWWHFGRQTEFCVDDKRNAHTMHTQHGESFRGGGRRDGRDERGEMAGQVRRKWLRRQSLRSVSTKCVAIRVMLMPNGTHWHSNMLIYYANYICVHLMAANRDETVGSIQLETTKS